MYVGVYGLSLQITEQPRERVARAGRRAAIKGVKAFYRIARHARMLITLMNIYSIAACNLSQTASQRARGRITSDTDITYAVYAHTRPRHTTPCCVARSSRSVCGMILRSAPSLRCVRQVRRHACLIATFSIKNRINANISLGELRVNIPDYTRLRQDPTGGHEVNSLRRHI